MFADIFSILSPVLISVAIGFFWVKSGHSYDIKLITALVTNFSTPALMFYTLATVKLSSDQLLEMGIAAICANLVLTLLGFIFLKVLQLPIRAFLQTLTFPNIGNLGLPVCFLAFGQEGLALAMPFFAVYAIFQMTIGVVIISGRFSSKDFTILPIILSTILALMFLVFSIPVPKWLFNTTKLIGDMTIPLMLLTLGVSLAQLKLASLKIPVILSVARLIFGLGVGIALAAILNLDKVSAGVVILECAMPAAVFCYLFAQQFRQHPHEVAGTVALSTLLGFVTLPLLLIYVL